MLQYLAYSNKQYVLEILTLAHINGFNFYILYYYTLLKGKIENKDLKGESNINTKYI